MASFDMAMSGQTSQPKQKSYSKVLHTKRAIRGLICILFCLLSLLPFLLMVMNATRTSGDIQAGVSLIPSSHLMENWNMLLQKQNGMRLTLGRAMLNSLCITVPGTFLAVYCSCMTAYGIHVYNFKAKKFAWAFIMGNHDGAEPDYNHWFLPFYVKTESGRYLYPIDYSLYRSTGSCILHETVYGKYLIH